MVGLREVPWASFPSPPPHGPSSFLCLFPGTSFSRAECFPGPRTRAEDQKAGVCVGGVSPIGFTEKQCLKHLGRRPVPSWVQAGSGRGPHGVEASWAGREGPRCAAVSGSVRVQSGGWKGPRPHVHCPCEAGRDPARQGDRV